MLQSITLGGQTFALAELRAGDLRRIPELAAALTAMLQYGTSAANSATFPNADHLSRMVVILFASASRANPDVTRETVDAAVDNATMSETFNMITAASGVVFGDDPPAADGASPGEAASPSRLEHGISTGASSPPPA